MTTEFGTCVPVHPHSTILGANPHSTILGANPHLTILGAKNSQVLAVSGTTKICSSRLFNCIYVKLK